MYEADCLDFLATVPDASVDLAFADPPFNLGKAYTSQISDAREEGDYLAWCETWLLEMVRTLKPGGSLMLWNLPKWNLPLGGMLSRHLTFRHWITVDIKYSLPIKGRLYPAHYSLLYFTKGERPAVFHPDRVPIQCCRHCGGEIKDYGGHKSKMNPAGVNLSDVWTDIPPVRHAKHKHREANALSLKLLDRVICMATGPGDVVLDPFGGSGTTYVAAELTGRQWLGSELDCSAAVSRLSGLDADKAYLAALQQAKNRLFLESDVRRREKLGNPISSAYRSAGACGCLM
ncbi:site-specific DNA-methyltransferase (adenine-specific) [Pseudomonas nitritireducens]|uniref:Methyltransferase n=1 Tax=Pseudomonas nitroreducens TaxID=46680 RepID=A0A7W7P3M7_PSENT|nr:site-specific DNA-methyltransferase [Pseudomonas nitritireducens]MBB4865417.1 site-specific DNA-methyltransferase (adenine-specific) [Pseudomonas nitritireducens]